MKQKTLWNATPPVKKQEWEACHWRACVSKNYACICTQSSKAHSWHLTENFLSCRKVQNLHYLGVNSSLTSTQGTEAGGKVMLWNFPSFGLISPPTHSLFVTKISVRRGGEGNENCFHFQNTGALPRLPSAHRHSSHLSLLWLPAGPPLPPPWYTPTTRWRRVFYSGNSVCRIRCWLSEVLWLFQQLLGASGPTAGGFYRPSRLGTGSGSLDDKGERKSVTKQKHFHVKLLKNEWEGPFLSGVRLHQTDDSKLCIPSKYSSSFRFSCSDKCV